MGSLNYILCAFLAISPIFYLNAQQSYDPFQYGNSPNPIQAPSVPSLEQLRNNSQTQINSTNYEAMKKIGYVSPLTQADIIANQQRQLQGKAPLPSRQQQIEKEMVGLLRELNKREQKIQQNDYYHSPEYIQDVPNYTKAKDLIKSMLDGKIPLSIKDAYYFEESAYGNLHLSYEEYNKVIKDNASFIKQWLKENKYNLTNPEALHFGIQKFLSDTIYITVAGKKQGHLPYFYDYIDALAKKDKRNYFVTKTLATGGGQCNTFPILYLILAEQLGVTANLAYNPQHTFIRYANDQGVTVNYETTVGRIMPDQFYLEILPVMAKSQKNKIILNNLNKKQIIATRLFDLAQDFIEEHYLGDTSFIKECLAIATPYFPNEEYICIANYNVKKTLYANTFNTMVQQKGIKNMSEIEKYPDVAQAYHNYYDYMEKINNLGVQDFPESEYMQLLKYYDVKGKLQIAKHIDGKSKKSLFIN